jgi:hypothetical protein
LTVCGWPGADDARENRLPLTPDLRQSGLGKAHARTGEAAKHGVILNFRKENPQPVGTSKGRPSQKDVDDLPNHLLVDTGDICRWSLLAVFEARNMA